jgi:hypothetical protein
MKLKLKTFLSSRQKFRVWIDHPFYQRKFRRKEKGERKKEKKNTLTAQVKRRVTSAVSLPVFMTWMKRFNPIMRMTPSNFHYLRHIHPDLFYNFKKPWIYQ